MSESELTTLWCIIILNSLKFTYFQSDSDSDDPDPVVRLSSFNHDDSDVVHDSAVAGICDGRWLIVGKTLEQNPMT